MFSILCQDSVSWLKKIPDGSVKNFVTGIPDMNELGDITLAQYLEFFKEVAGLIFRKLNPNGYCIFIQTDRKFKPKPHSDEKGCYIDKSYLLTDVAVHSGAKLLWHKIVCLRDVGKKDLYRPTYSHYLCYTYKGTPGVAFEDVLPVGHKLYDNATPDVVAESAVEFVKQQMNSRRGRALRSADDSEIDRSPDVVDPFVGQGTIGIKTVAHGLSFLGIDIDRNQCEIARKLLGSVRSGK